MTFGEASQLLGPLDLFRQPPLYATYQESILRVGRIQDHCNNRPCVYPAVLTCSRIYDGCRLHRAYINGNTTCSQWAEWEE